jgi:hypothetical protein
VVGVAAGRQAVCGTGFHGSSRQWLRESVRTLGMRYCAHLIREDYSFLVVAEAEASEASTSAKIQRAIQWQHAGERRPVQVRAA